MEQNSHLFSLGHLGVSTIFTLFLVIYTKCSVKTTVTEGYPLQNIPQICNKAGFSALVQENMEQRILKKPTADISSKKKKQFPRL